MNNKKILLTTVYKKGKLYDYFGSNIPKRNFFRLTLVRRISYGLRFLKHNIPQLDIMEYPSFNRFKRAIKKGKYDIVGFSFYLNETDHILKMAAYARKQGVKVLWAGNYGALTPEISRHFDKIFLGYSEHEVAKELGITIDRIKHPPFISYIGSILGIKIARMGILQTTRGCSMPCTFCQSTTFAPKPMAVPIESIEEVLKEYKRLGIVKIIINDESFGIIKKHTEQVIELLAKYKLHWFPMVRDDILLKNLDKWHALGLRGAQIGIESFSQNNLDNVGKKKSVETIKELCKKAEEKKLFMIGYYIIGFEHDTVESVKRDIIEYKNLNIDIYQICVMTPFPATQLHDTIRDTYGIVDKKYERYNAKHLVWNHPHISIKEMRKLLFDSMKTVYTRETFFRTIMKFRHNILKDAGENTDKMTSRSLVKFYFDINYAFYIRKDYR